MVEVVADELLVLSDDVLVDESEDELVPSELEDERDEPLRLSVL